jgi:glycosyltransferase involved in cell wall biosynthesis
MVVGRDIARVFEKLGHSSVLFNRKIQWYDARKEFRRGIILIPFDPLYAQLYFLLARDYCMYGIPAIIYTTVEGEPKRWLIREWVKRDCMFITNSMFTKQMLDKVGVKTTKIIPHGVDMDAVNRLKPESEKRKQQLKQEMGVKVLFGTVASGHPRKGMKQLSDSLKIAVSKMGDAGFYVLTTPLASDFFVDIKNVKPSPHFGDLPRDDILTLIGSFDFLIHPALCEGFGLTIIEANAFGVPVIYPEYAPLTEIAHPTANFPVKIEREEYKDLGDGILYLCHYYTSEAMTDQICKAYEKYTCSQDEYLKLSRQVQEHAGNYDVMKLYSEFLKT